MKKILFFITLFASFIIIKDLVVSIYTVYHKKDLLMVAQKELDLEKEENRRLRSELAHVQKTSFIEAQARDKLFLVKNGESIVVVPKTTQTQKSKDIQVQKPNWQAWWELFF